MTAAVGLGPIFYRRLKPAIGEIVLKLKVE